MGVGLGPALVELQGFQNTNRLEDKIQEAVGRSTTNHRGDDIWKMVGRFAMIVVMMGW